MFFFYKLDYKILIRSNIQNQTHRILFFGRSYGASLLASFFSLLLLLHSADQDSDSVTVTWLLHHIFYFCPSVKAGRALLEQKSQQCFGRGDCPTDEESQMLHFYPSIWVFDMRKLCDGPPQLLVYLDSLTLGAVKVNFLLSAHCFIFRNLFFSFEQARSCLYGVDSQGDL